MNIRSPRSQVITLTTDFGTRDGYVGAMKGRILSICPSARIVDITHDIPPQGLRTGALTLMRSVPGFPGGTIHLAVVDPGVGSGRAGLVVECESGLLVGPDNGLLSLVLEKLPPRRVMRICPETTRWKKHCSFDGLSLFAPVAAYLAQGMDLEEAGDEVREYVRISLPKPQIVADGIVGEIIAFDRFGNAITNIGPEHLSNLSHEVLQVHCGQCSIPIQKYYSQSAGEPASVFALINSDGLLEIAVYNASAQSFLKLRRGDEVRVVGE